MKTNFKLNLLLGFGASLLILILSSVASYLSISNLLDSSQWVNHTQEVIAELRSVSSALGDAETNQRGYLLTSDPKFLSPYQDAREKAKTALSHVSALTKDNEGQQETMDALNNLVTERFTILQRVIDLKDSSGGISAADIEAGRIAMGTILEKINMMEAREQQLLLERTSRLDTFSRFTPVLIVIAAVVALIITISFYYKVRNDFSEKSRLQQELEEKDIEISKRIDIIRDLADQLAKGNYAIRIDEGQRDALGSVAGSLNKMASSLDESFNLLSDKEWLQTGIAKLNDIMIGEKNTSELSSHIIEFLARYTDSHVGALYTMERNYLQFQGGYAFLPDAKRERFKLGEGLVGQAAAGGNPVELKNISAENIQISYASGEASPSNVIAVPLYDGYAIKGVVEVASIKNYTEREKDFLKTSARNIGIAISTAQNRKQLQELLEETQAQSEELKSQQAEMENVNSELEVQAEKLQTSEEELRVQQEELRQANQELEERSRLLEERNQQISENNYDIKTKADQLAQSARYKSEFLANMSHELRTPLNSILLLSRLMSENNEANLTPDQVEYARVIQSSGHGLLALIDEILDLSKIESGKMQLEMGTIAVEEIIQDMDSLFRPISKEKGIEFKTTVSAQVPVRIETDKLRLEQIVRNLLSNAIKFTAKGYVSLDFTMESSLLKIVVKDTGIGVPKEKQEVIFEAFQQADGSTRRKYGGTGLGLSISRELAKLLGGEIQLRSEPDRGSEFALYIPITKADQEKKLTQVKINELKFEDAEPRPVVDQKYISTITPENIPDDRGKISPSDKVMLIVEDDINFAKSLLDYTRKRGYKGVVAVRGDEGVELARGLSPVGILLDIQLPVLSGWEVMDILKNDPLTRHIPVHIMSSYEVKSESLLKGAVDFINKPVAFEKMQEIFQKIEYVLTHHPKKVLIVEENAKHAKALAYFLETFDINLEIKNGVSEAIASLKGKDIDCVILDMGIPDQKSYDTLEEVKKTPGLENLPIIIFTGKSLSAAEELRIKQYADSIVIKTAHSYKRILDEVSLFLHLMENSETTKPTSVRPHKLGALDEVLKGKTVLVADDDMRNIFSLTKALENYKMNVITAVDGKDALKQLKANPGIDIVLMDMMMPEMDGYETTSAIRRDRKYKDLPVIAVTAKAMTGDRIKCINAGASDYITKPVDIDQLLSLLRVWLYEK